MRKTNQPRTSIKGILIGFIITLFVGAIYFYFVLPPLNPRSTSFWVFLILLLAVYLVTQLVATGFRLDFNPGNGPQFYTAEGQQQIFMDTGRVFKSAGKQVKSAGIRIKLPLFLIALIIVICFIGTVSGFAIFNASRYYDLLNIQVGDFSSDVADISYNEIPMLDRDSSVQLGKRALGNISTNGNLVSQFEVADEAYSQINYQGEPVRVAPLRYGNLIKLFNNCSEGLPGYIIVNMVSQEATLVQLESGMKYSNYEYFGRNLNRLLRFRYPTMMFGDINFEIDEDGTPWWICSRVVKTIGLFSGADTQGAVLVNAVTGESTYYEEVPSWVDRVYSADLLVEQYNYHGAYVNGWINSWLGEKGVTTTTDGCNYIALNDDVYLYTGVTSAGADESNVGFILINQRTKAARYYNITGAEEYSAMSSAEGAVQHLNYTATFPLLLNIADQPTYFMALKDSAELVKMYAMVNVSDYQITATGASVMECQTNYEALLAENGIQITSSVEEDATEIAQISGQLVDIRSAVVDGNTIFYLSLDGEIYYAISASDCPEAVILNVGDTVTITYTPGGSLILEAVSVE